MLVLALWRYVVGSVSVNNITSPKVEIFYWTAILFSNTLGTALGDFLADSSGLGYEGGALVFAAMLALIAAAYFFTEISHTLLFWMAFILTRPLGATFGDLLTKPYANGGLNLNRINSSLVIAALIVGCILLMLKEGVVHRPIRGLSGMCRDALRRLRRVCRVGVQLAQRKVAKDESEFVAEPLL